MLPILHQPEVAQPIRKAIAELIFKSVQARIAAGGVDRSDHARVERLLREEVARYNAETTSGLRVMLHTGTEIEDGFQVAFEVVRKWQEAN